MKGLRFFKFFRKAEKPCCIRAGRVSEITGCVSEITGRVSEITGRVSEITGRVLEITGTMPSRSY